MLHNLGSAQEYDEYASRGLQPWDMIFIRRISQAVAGFPGGGLLLDIGTGTGVVPIKLAQMPEFARFRIVGLDSDETMLSQGRANADRLGLDARVSFQLGDAHRLPFGDDSVSLAVSRATLHHLPDKPGALREMHRILTPGGVGLVHDMRRDAPPEALAEFARLRQAADYPPTNIAEKLTLEEARNIIECSGLQACTRLVSGWQRGAMALGYEILIRKILRKAAA